MEWNKKVIFFKIYIFSEWKFFPNTVCLFVFCFFMFFKQNLRCPRILWKHSQSYLDNSWLILRGILFSYFWIIHDHLLLDTPLPICNNCYLWTAPNYLILVIIIILPWILWVNSNTSFSNYLIAYQQLSHGIDYQDNNNIIVYFLKHVRGWGGVKKLPKDRYNAIAKLSKVAIV